MNYEEINTQELKYFLKQLNTSTAFTIETGTGCKLTFNTDSTLSNEIQAVISNALNRGATHG